MKQAIVARTDVGMGQGKLAAQVAHASLSAYEKAERRTQDRWKQGGQKKVVLKGESERQLHELSEIADSKGIANALIRDAGHTQLEPGTVTALAVGPAEEDIVDRVTGELSLF
ncbi:peptidyl-tRNA hydrolase Pth2 [Natronobacterium texcoconense]|uniref:Peptidyl-tRNA hydrolase n=1 Tax=Natronobacterium texcoconense TaxID=1095778 RepID=A0A1H1AQ56_NATTX|nr:peptidyl-tRNA hydrolase Pth2 [Natronobacterium texcoconense]SDQ41807.1 peptidyl-tRNA hydrolase [Natronobacterium texcoconense]